MTKEQLDDEFFKDVTVVVNHYKGGLLPSLIENIPPGEKIDILFCEMKQIWLRRMELEMKGSE